MVRISISISDEILAFLQLHCISPSKLLQKEVNILIQKDLDSVKVKPFVELEETPYERFKNETIKDSNSNPV